MRVYVRIYIVPNAILVCTTNKIQMTHKLIIHADDFGLTKEATNGILKGCDANIISSVSIIPNGLAFEYGILEIKKRPHLRMSIHLNLLEGYPVVNKNHVDQLIDREGKFCHSFLGLWIKYNKLSVADKGILKEQIKTELKAQIQKVRDHMGDDCPVNIDSHNHFHLIPFIFEILLEFTQELKIHYIRVPEEKFFWCLTDWHSFSKYISVNVIKHHLLNHLSHRWKERLNQLSISYSQYFIGVLFSGCMSSRVVRQGLRTLNNSASDKGVIETLFHPGRAKEDELKDWVRGNRFKDYYCSAWRDYELKQLLEPSFKNFIKQFNDSV